MRRRRTRIEPTSPVYLIDLVAVEPKLTFEYKMRERRSGGVSVEQANMGIDFATTSLEFAGEKPNDAVGEERYTVKPRYNVSLETTIFQRYNVTLKYTLS
jgi:hypothetical protein